MDKIEIVRVAAEIFSHKGFDDRGCYGSSCRDSCCRLGCDADRESYDLIVRHRHGIEKRLERKIEDCFEKEWSRQTDFLGRDSIASTIINGSCALHLADGKGCVLFQMIKQENCPVRILPSTCRLYPITWADGVMLVKPDLEKSCNCLDPANPGSRVLWDTQKEAIEDIFIING